MWIETKMGVLLNTDVMYAIEYDAATRCTVAHYKDGVEMIISEYDVMDSIRNGIMRKSELIKVV